MSTSVKADVATAIATARQAMEEYGGMIDIAVGTGVVYCDEVIARYFATLDVPEIDVTGAPGEVVAAYDQYKQALTIFADGAYDMTGNCADFLANPQGGSIPFQQWGLARMRVNEAVAVLYAAAALVQ